MATWLGNLLTSFENGLLGVNLPAGTNSTAKAIGNLVKRGLEAVPGVKGMAANAAKAGAVQGRIAANTGSSVSSGLKGAFDYAVSTGKDLVLDPVKFAESNRSSPSVSYVPSDGGTSVPVPDYAFADIAKIYGMDASTAYQEALSNTSYQRAVQDLQAAGINPLMAVQGMSGASGVYAAHLAGDGSVSTGVSSAKGAHTYYNLLSNTGTAIGALIGGRTGSIAGKAIGTVLGNALDG